MYYVVGGFILSKYRIKERIKAIFVWRDVSFEKYARKIFKDTGKTVSTSGLSHKLSRETIPFKEVIEIADTLGYDVVFKPRSSWKPWDDIK